MDNNLLEEKDRPQMHDEHEQGDETLGRIVNCGTLTSWLPCAGCPCSVHCHGGAGVGQRLMSIFEV